MPVPKAAITCCVPLQRRQHERPPRPQSLRIYEAHVGMSSEEPKVATYLEFRGQSFFRHTYSIRQYSLSLGTHFAADAAGCSCVWK